MFYTIGMKTNSSENTESRWQKTPVANLVRHVQSGNYYARIRVRGKLIWKSLKTDRISVAKLRLGDFHKEERQRASTLAAVARGKMSFGDALATYQQKLQNDPNIKPKTREYYDFRIKALLKSWPELKNRDVSKISRAECEAWSVSNAKQVSSSSHNQTVGILRHVFQIAIEAGARYDNPALAAKRVKQQSKLICRNHTSLNSLSRRSGIQEAVFPNRPPNWFNFWPTAVFVNRKLNSSLGAIVILSAKKSP